jgi:hypothetical protein
MEALIEMLKEVRGFLDKPKRTAAEFVKFRDRIDAVLAKAAAEAAAQAEEEEEEEEDEPAPVSTSKKAPEPFKVVWSEGVKDTTYRFCVLPDMRVLQVRCADPAKKSWMWAVSRNGSPVIQGSAKTQADAKAAVLKAAGL